MANTIPSPTERYEDAAQAFIKLLTIMAALRTPGTGCPWDLEQDFSTIAPYTIEEAYEVADAIERNELRALAGELGDLLFQVVFHARMGEEDGIFDIADVVEAISSKMIRRHPHVFSQGEERSAEEQTQAWEEMKAAERAEGAASHGGALSALDGVATALPALMRAEKLQKRAARVGFDWLNPEPIFDKLAEEASEVRSAMRDGSADKIEEEIGDLLFVCANLARRLGIDPEHALRRANTKFERRFRAMEALAAQDGPAFAERDLEAQESLWQAVKRAERKT